MTLNKSLKFFKKHKKTYVCNINTISGVFHSAFGDKKQETKEPWIKCRHVVVLFTFLTDYFLYSLRITMAVSIVAMVNNTALPNEEDATSESCQELVVNVSDSTEQLEEMKDGEFLWSPQLQGYILGSGSLCYALGTVTMGKFTEMFGAKNVLFWGIFLSSLLTFLTPFAAWCNVYLLIIVQGLRGFFQSSAFPAMSALIANWCPITERGLSLTITLSGSCFGAVVASYISGLLCGTSLLGGWPLAFFVNGASGIIVSLGMGLFLYDNPNAHPKISQAELKYILENQERALVKERPKTPWISILTSMPIYAVAYGYFGQVWSLTYFLAAHPTFLGTILHYSIEKNGLFSALPFFLQIMTSVGGGWISQLLINKKCMSVDTSRKFWNFLGCLGYSACLLGMYFAGCRRSLTIVLSIISVAFIGFGNSGSAINSVDLSPTFAASVNAFTSSIAYVSTFIMPVVVGWLTDGRQTIEQWNKIMFISIAVVMSSGIVFAIFGSAEVQPWNDPERKSERRTENTQL